MASPETAAATKPDTGDEPTVSKRAAEKARKKVEKAAKKTELASRPKDATPSSTPAPSDSTSTPSTAAISSKSSESISIFDGGWLKGVYNEKPVKNVRTRFPPEPNGYLHIGHAKAISVNFGFARHYGGICFLRFDDTNPEKEEEKFFTSIKDMVRWLGFEPYQVTHSSDHFDRLYELAEELIRRDKAYVDHSTEEELKKSRGMVKRPDGKWEVGGERFASPYRDRPVEESLKEFRAMKDGKYKPGEAFLRMKMDIKNDNPQMWDVAAYRIIKDSHHYRTGDKWRIYPTYDFTHCLCDAFEEITHSLCTTEFETARESYDWLLEALDFKKPGTDEKGPMQREYGRLNLAGTILSKRRIEVLVKGVPEKNIPPAVPGWDDPRLYTLVAIRRRGVPAGALLRFVAELGVTKDKTNIETVRFEATIRRYLEDTVPRLMLVLDPVPVVIEDLPEDFSKDLSVPFHPKKPEMGSRTVPFTQTIYIDRSDFREEESKDFFRLAPGKAVGLLTNMDFPVVIKATSFSKDFSGHVTEIKATRIEGVKPKAYIHWVGSTHTRVVARVYNALFQTGEPNNLDWKEGGWAESLNPESEVIHDDALIEKGLEDLRKTHADNPSGASDDIVRFQATRTAYFCIDPDTSEDGRVVLNRIVSLKEDKAK